MNEKPVGDRSLSSRRWLGPGIAVLIAAVVVLLLLTLTPRHESATETVHGKSNTTVSGWLLPALNGKNSIALVDYRGKPVVVNFFASWCTSCQRELPLFAAAAKQLQGSVTFVGVNAEETGDGAEMARRYGIADWPLARDVGGAADSGLHDALGGTGMPITAFYDSNGKLQFVAQGALSAATLSADLLQYSGRSVTLATPSPS